jgi:hypothetical protein
MANKGLITLLLLCGLIKYSDNEMKIWNEMDFISGSSKGRWHPVRPPLAPGPSVAAGAAV